MAAYIDATKHLRTPEPEDRLFVCLVHPHHPVSAATLGRWIKSTLQHAGIETTVFGAHSVRGAAASAAIAKNCSVEQVLLSGDWTSANTFTRFYNKLIYSSRNSSSLGSHAYLSRAISGGFVDI